MDKVVSIVSPCYNGEKYLSSYLNSVLEQTYPEIELILVDDASTDATAEIVKQYETLFKNKGYTLIYIKQESNKGQAAAINRGLKIFSGNFFTWMDSDDIYYNDAIQKKVEFLEKNTEYDFVLNDGEIVNEKDLCTRVGVLKRQKPSNNDNLFKDLLDENNVVFTPGVIMVRADALKRAIPNLSIYESREGQNWQLMLPLAYSLKYGYLDEILFKYVVHNGSHSHMKRLYERQIERRDNFYVLQKETISKITDMPKSEKEYWIQYSYKKQLKEKYILTLKNRRRKDYAAYKKEMKKYDVDIPEKMPYDFYQIYIILRKIKNKLKRNLMK
ncbi:glycosyltransferase family 2 protein [Blautia sp. OF03-15BH]|nr:glycosyltransferase family 2 protein [Blautia sp. OF03-15BH]